MVICKQYDVRYVTMITLPVALTILGLLVYALVTNNVIGWVILTDFGAGYSIFACLPLFVIEPELGVVAYFTTLIAGAICDALKYFFRLPRPPPYLWRVRLPRCYYWYGFPSGHTMMAAASYGFISIVFRRYLQVVITCWLFIISVALSRVMLYVHYPRDVIGGAIFGFIIAIIMYLLYSRSASKYKDTFLILFSLLVFILVYSYCRFIYCIIDVSVGIGIALMHFLLKDRYDIIRRGRWIWKVVSIIVTVPICVLLMHVPHNVGLLFIMLSYFTCGVSLVAIPFIILCLSEKFR
ncbi:MAG: phosphatase PAP2 family protein [Crenarchaeota archaeon]|nr:phosphatase PAP2 family protein [Thermoproteota archaeon]